MGRKTEKALGGALKGAGKGAAIGSVVPGIGTAVGAGVGGLIGGVSGFFGGKADEEMSEAQRAAEIASGKLAVEKSEDRRLAAIQAAGGMMPQMAERGFMALDPELMASLGARRNYDELIEAGAVDPTAGAGSAFLAGLGDTALDIGSQLAESELIGGGVGGVGTAEDPALQGPAVYDPTDDPD